MPKDAAAPAMPATHLAWQPFSVCQHMRAAKLQQTPCLLWFTGLSGSGKSTLAGMLEARLFQLGYQTYLLDGDNVRHGLCRDLGFGMADRAENIRRVGEVSQLFLDAGLIVLTAFISPFRKDRALVRERVGAPQFVEIHLSTALDVCEARDPKGLYQRARRGELPDFTGIDSPYEAPENPQIRLDTAHDSAEQCVAQLLDYLYASGRLTGSKSSLANVTFPDKR